MTGKTWWLKFANGCPVLTAYKFTLSNGTETKKHKIPIDIDALGMFIPRPNHAISMCDGLQL